MVPEGIKAQVGHFEHPADVGRLALIEKEIGGGRIAIKIVGAFQEAQGHEGIEEIARRAGMQSDPSPQGLQLFRVFCKFGEQLHFDRAQENLGGPEAQTNLQDQIRSRLVHRRESFRKSAEICASEADAS
jgi:hypothetical protein